MAVYHTRIAPSSGRMLAAILPPYPRASSCRQVHLLPRGWRVGVPPARADVHTPSILWAAWAGDFGAVCLLSALPLSLCCHVYQKLLIYAAMLLQHSAEPPARLACPPVRNQLFEFAV